jgi:hypothetical protein
MLHKSDDPRPSTGVTGVGYTHAPDVNVDATRVTEVLVLAANNSPCLETSLYKYHTLLG